MINEAIEEVRSLLAESIGREVYTFHKGLIKKEKHVVILAKQFEMADMIDQLDQLNRDIAKLILEAV